MAKKKEPKKETLEQKLYNSAERQRGKVAPSDYKDLVLGLLFLKFISYWYDQRRKDIEKRYRRLIYLNQSRDRRREAESVI